LFKQTENQVWTFYMSKWNDTNIPGTPGIFIWQEVWYVRILLQGKPRMQ
jgi:hypothetical protein